VRKTTIATFIFSLGILTFAVGCNDANVANVGNARSNNAAVVTNANRTVTNTAPAANTAGDVKIADITGNMNNYAGKTVTVSGWVERTYGANSFELDEDSVFTGGIDNDLLVVGAANVIPAGMKFGDADAKVRVTGTVRRLVIAEIERDLGFDLTPEIETEFRDKAVLVANSVQVIKRDE